MSQIYLDYNATTPIRPEVITLITQIMAEPGNASSVHGYGRNAKKYIENARKQVATAINAKASQVIFNSGATEGNNTVLKQYKGDEVWISAIEHSSVINTAIGAVHIPVTKDGVVDLDALKEMLATKPLPKLVSIMLVNSETGIIQPVKEAVELIRAASPDIKTHTDATQGLGRIPVDIKDLCVDYMTISAHKLGGPHGVGALVMGPCSEAPRLILGGTQENRCRAGTENVEGIAGFGLAVELAIQNIEKYNQLCEWRDEMQAELLDTLPEATVFGANAPRVANTLNISWPGQQASMLLMNFDLEGVALSTGSACSSGTMKPSHVLMAMHASEDDVRGALRISMGWNTKKEEVDQFISIWQKIVGRVKKAA